MEFQIRKPRSLGLPIGVRMKAVGQWSWHSDPRPFDRGKSFLGLPCGSQWTLVLARRDVMTISARKLKDSSTNNFAPNSRRNRWKMTFEAHEPFPSIS
ncbi:hypothetical protein GH714_013971 [Hevea brasiliensis]|uniref:Uncharacterized protein n=1 Tax=Hevea brasiliensis TaxID=3981 RepID=A0A6A6LQ00_HEVBR|nr:hypothetical protein GH714_013971 [Hevea brasiliensis]